MQHVIRTAEVEDDRTAWACSCGRAGSVGEWGNVELASDKHIDCANGHTRMDRPPLVDDPW
jgi:hypothetical protein